MGTPQPPGALQSLELSVQTGCGFQAPRDPAPAQNLPSSSSGRAGFRGWAPASLRLGLGFPRTNPPHLPGPS